MKKMIVASALTAALTLGAAGAAMAESGNANQNACFGQDRAAWIHANSGKAWGDIASDRAGDNSSINAAYREACQAA